MKSIIVLLGIADILSAILFWLSSFFHFIPSNWILIIAFYLLVKGSIFLISKDFASILDIIAAVIMFISFNFTFPAIVYIIVSLYLLQKGIFSLIT
jgi:hypothetical protein